MFYPAIWIDRTSLFGMGWGRWGVGALKPHCNGKGKRNSTIHLAFLLRRNKTQTCQLLHEITPCWLFWVNILEIRHASYATTTWQETAIRKRKNDIKWKAQHMTLNCHLFKNKQKTKKQATPTTKTTTKTSTKNKRTNKKTHT